MQVFYTLEKILHSYFNNLPAYRNVGLTVLKQVISPPFGDIYKVFPFYSSFHLLFRLSTPIPQSKRAKRQREPQLHLPIQIIAATKKGLSRHHNCLSFFSALSFGAAKITPPVDRRKRTMLCAHLGKYCESVYQRNKKTWHLQEMNAT